MQPKNLLEPHSKSCPRRTEYEDDYDWGTMRLELPSGTSDAGFLCSIAQTQTISRQKKQKNIYFRSLRSPSTLPAPSRSPIVLELVLVLGFFSSLRSP
jgi:hypothetical protein